MKKSPLQPKPKWVKSREVAPRTGRSDSGGWGRWILFWFGWSDRPPRRHTHEQGERRNEGEAATHEAARRTPSIQAAGIGKTTRGCCRQARKARRSAAIATRSGRTPAR